MHEIIIRIIVNHAILVNMGRKDCYNVMKCNHILLIYMFNPIILLTKRHRSYKKEQYSEISDMVYKQILASRKSSFFLLSKM